eukprot:364282-Chlamydomonas_euryale.AAC.61
MQPCTTWSLSALTFCSMHGRVWMPWSLDVTVAEAHEGGDALMIPPCSTTPSTHEAAQETLLVPKRKEKVQLEFASRKPIKKERRFVRHASRLAE